MYSTCTVNIDENHNQVMNFLGNNPEFKLVSEKQFLPTENIDGFYVCKMVKNM